MENELKNSRKQQKVRIEFTLYGDIQKELFIEQLRKWVNQVNEMILDPAEIPNVDMIEFEVRS